MGGRCIKPFQMYILFKLLDNFLSYSISFYHLLIDTTFIVFCQASNLLYVDQPVGTGFSYSTDESDFRHDEGGVSNDLYDFVQVCLLSHVYVRASMKKETRIMHLCLITCDWNLSGSSRFTNFSTLFQAFFKKHPQFAKNDFYITGESYAGHYIPAFATRIHQGNKAKEGIHIKLKVAVRFNQS